MGRVRNDLYNLYRPGEGQHVEAVEKHVLATLESRVGLANHSDPDGVLGVHGNTRHSGLEVAWEVRGTSYPYR